MRRALRIAALLLLLAGSLAGGLLALLGMDSLYPALARQLMQQWPALTVEQVRGNLRDGLVIQRLHWRGEPAVELRQLRLGVSLWCAPRRHLCLHPLSVHHAAITLPASADTDTDTFPLPLRDIRLPLSIFADSLAIGELTLRNGDSLQRITGLQARLELREDRLLWQDLRLAHETFSATLRGELHTQGDYPLELAADLQLPGQQLHLSATGSLRALGWRASSIGQLPFQAEGKLDLRSAMPHLQASAALTAPWQHDSVPELTVQALAAHIEGPFDALSLSLTGQARMREHALTAEGQAHWQNHALTLNTLTIRQDEQRLHATGQLTPEEDRWRWQLAVTGQQLDASLLHASLDSTLQLALNSTGEWSEGHWHGEFHLHQLAGDWRGQPLRGEARLLSPDGLRWQLPTAELRIGDNHLKASGSHAPEAIALLAELQAPVLHQLWPGLDGRLSGRLQGSGQQDRPDLQAALTGSALHWQDTRADALTLEARWRDGSGALTLGARALLQGEQTLGNWQLAASGSADSHRLTLQGGPKSMALRTALSGQWRDDTWQGDVRQLDITAKDLGSLRHWSLESPWPVRWQAADGNISLARRCLRSGDSRLCLEAGGTPDQGSARLAWQHLPLGNLTELIMDITSSQALDGQTALAWQQGALTRLEGDLTLSAGTLALRGQPGQIRLLPSQARWRLDGKGVDTQVSLNSEELGQLRVEARLPRPGQGDALSGTLRLHNPSLAPLAAFLPEHSTLAGSLHASGRLHGTLRSPAFDGQLRLNSLAAQSPRWPVRLKSGQLSADIRGQQATFSGLLRFDEGNARLQGEARWSLPEWFLHVASSGEGMHLTPLGGVELWADHALNIHANQAGGELHGNLHIPRARATLSQLPSDAVHESGDVILEGTAPEAPYLWQANLGISLGEDVRFRGFGLSTDLEGRLRLRATQTEQLQAYGNLSLRDGEYKAYGQELTIRTGQLQFTGPLTRPRLSFEAVREVDGYVAGLRLTGPADRPSSTLFSTPALPDNEILSLLFTGQRLDNVATGVQTDILSRAALSLGVAGSGGTLGKVAGALGVEDFSIGTASSAEGSQVQLSGKLSPRLTVRYGVGVFDRGNELTLRYKLYPRLYLEATSGVENTLEFIYSFDWL